MSIQLVTLVGVVFNIMGNVDAMSVHHLEATIIIIMMYNVGEIAGTENCKHSYRRIAHQIHIIKNNNFKKKNMQAKNVRDMLERK